MSQESEATLVPYDFYNIAERLNSSVLDAISNAINKKISEIFIYPRSQALSKEDPVQWPTIGDFSLETMTEQICKYIDSWNLRENTKYVIKYLSCEEYELRGYKHLVEVAFSRPTNSCPNPLAIARVLFYTYVSSLLPKSFPVMVSYRFEGYKSTYNAGGVNVRKSGFQDYMIDLILKSKLLFYSELCERTLSS